MNPGPNPVRLLKPLREVGIAGHAGLFSTAGDLAKYAAAMLNRGEYQNVRVMKEETWSLMTSPGR